MLPPTLTAQYHFNPHGAVRPYLGAGVNYSIFSKEDIKKRIGRSPDDGDAVILAMCTGAKRMQPRRNDFSALNRPTTYDMGRANIRRR